jgi:hypothetical protein
MSKNSSDSDTSQSPTPPTGVLPPPTTPVTPAVPPKNLTALNLDPVDENDPLILAKLADPNSSLADSQYAPNEYNPTKQRVATPYPSPMMPTPARGQETGSIDRLRLDRLMPDHPRSQVQQDILDRKARRNNLPTPAAANSKQTVVGKTSSPIGSFEKDVVAKFKAQAEAREKDNENSKVTANTGALKVNDTEPFPAFEDDSNELVIKSPPSTPASMTDVALSVAGTGDSLSLQAMELIPPSPSAVQSPVKNEAKKEVAEVAYEAQAVLDNAKAELAFKTGRLSISQKEPGSPDGPTIITDSEDPAVREKATHFTSWGTPQARDTARRSSQYFPLLPVYVLIHHSRQSPQGHPSRLASRYRSDASSIPHLWRNNRYFRSGREWHRERYLHHLRGLRRVLRQVLKRHALKVQGKGLRRVCREGKGRRYRQWNASWSSRVWCLSLRSCDWC